MKRSISTVSTVSTVSTAIFAILLGIGLIGCAVGEPEHAVGTTHAEGCTCCYCIPCREPVGS